jgi:hypothetical protein
VPAGLRLAADKTTLDATDGTDDAQIIVTVVDKDGNALSNCPPVTLTIESGPGEFPTGPSITFAPDSDIVIRDGQAGIEFRSCYSGTTLIRATSPGLKDAVLEIASRGGPQYVPGKTPSVKLRPYVRFTGAAKSDSLITFGRANPTRASSEAPGHDGSCANDGNPATFWQAAAGDTNAWLCIDLERIVNVSSVNLRFPVAGNWQYRIEISEDGKAGWQLVAEQTWTVNHSDLRTDNAPTPAPHGRYLRVTITQSPANQAPALADVELAGTLRQQ